jgi:hypothetical protein
MENSIEQGKEPWKKITKFGGKMKSKFLTLLIGLLIVTSMSGIYAYDSANPYTVTMNFIVGADTSFTVELAGSETSIDFNPASLNSKEVEPDSQNAGASTPILTITNTGNTNLDFTHKLTAAKPDWVVISYNNDTNTVNWGKTLTDEVSNVEQTVASSGEVKVYMWANFTSALAGTTARTYQINSTVSS